MCLGKVDALDDLVVEFEPTSSNERNEGENITLRCEARIGVFTEELFWTKDNKALKIERGRMNVENWTDTKVISKLHIQNATIEDSGVYKCNAEKEGDWRYYQKSTTLTIKSK